MKKLVLTISAMAALAAHAQLDNTVTVTNEVKPVVKDADKINVFPTALDTQAKRTAVQYQQQAQPLTQFPVEPLHDYTSPAVLRGNKRGYAHLGGGSHGQLDAKAACLLDFTDADLLSIDFTLNGFNGKVTDLESNHRMYKNRYGLRYDHTLDNGLDLYAKGAFESHVFNYQHFPMIEYAYENERKPSNWTDKQNNMLGDVAVGISTFEAGDFTLSAEAGFEFFKQKYTANLADKYGETILRGVVDGKYAIGDEHFAEVGVELFNSNYSMAEVDGITHLHFTPHYIYSTDAMRFQAGIVAGTDGDIAPDVRFAYHLTPSSDLYVNAYGYDRDNTFRRLSAIHPYFVLNCTPLWQLDGITREQTGAGNLKIDAEFHKLNANIGYRFTDMHVGEGNKLSGDFNWGFDIADGCPWFSAAVADNWRWMPLAEFCDTRRFFVNLDASFNFHDILKMDMKSQFNNWQYRNDATGKWEAGNYIEPMLHIAYTVDVKVVNDVFVGASWEHFSYKNPEMPAADGDSAEPYKRPKFNNIGASVRYSLPTDTPLSVFVKADNLLNVKNTRYFNYRNIGFNVMAGVAVSF